MVLAKTYLRQSLETIYLKKRLYIVASSCVGDCVLFLLQYTSAYTSIDAKSIFSVIAKNKHCFKRVCVPTFSNINTQTQRRFFFFILSPFPQSLRLFTDAKKNRNEFYTFHLNFSLLFFYRNLLGRSMATSKQRILEIKNNSLDKSQTHISFEQRMLILVVF